MGEDKDEPFVDLTVANSHLLEELDGTLSIFLSPFYLDNLMLGVMRELNGQLLSYMDDQGGLLMGFSPPKIVGSEALLCPWLPYMDIQVESRLLLLKLLPGDILIGRAHDLSPGQLNLLVLGGVNAAISVDQLPPGYAYDTRNQLWVPDGDYGRAIMAGDVVACRVLSPPALDPRGPNLLFSLDASLLGRHTGLTPKQPRQQREKRQQLLAAAAAHQQRKQLKQQEKLQRKQEKDKTKQLKKAGKQQAKQQQQQQQEPMPNGLSASAAGTSAPQTQEQLSKAERRQLKEQKRAMKQQQQPSSDQQVDRKRKQAAAEAQQPAAKKQKRSSQQQQQQTPNGSEAPQRTKPKAGGEQAGSNHKTQKRSKSTP